MYAVNTEQEGPQLIELKIESPTSFNIEELPAKIGLTANLELQVEIINPERIKEFNILNVYPSPQIPGAPVNVQISSSSDESVLFYLQDVQGNIQIKLQVDLKKGINMISIPIEEATPSGIYILKCVNHKDQIAKRIIISK